MKFSQNAKAALARPDTDAVTTEMTPEMREKFRVICNDVIDLLRSRTKGPFEAYMALQFCMHALEDYAGIRGGVIIENNDEPSH